MSAITMANAKLNPFLVAVNFKPNSRFSSGKVTIPTIVSVVKKATAGTIPTPAFTSVPTSGKAIKAGTKVIVPNPAETIVADSSDWLPINSAIFSGGKTVKTKPIKNIIDKILPNIPLPIPNAILSAFLVFCLSLIREKTKKAAVPTHIANVNTSITLPPNSTEIIEDISIDK